MRKLKWQDYEKKSKMEKLQLRSRVKKKRQLQLPLTRKNWKSKQGKQKKPKKN